MDLHKLHTDVCNLDKNIHPNSRFLIEQHFEKRFGDTAEIKMKSWNEGHIKLYQQYFLHAKVKNKDVILFNLCKYNYPDPGFEYLTNIGIQDYPELVKVLRNYLKH